MKKKDLRLNLEKAKKVNFSSRKLEKRLKIILEQNKKLLAESEIDPEGLRIRFDV